MASFGKWVAGLVGMGRSGGVLDAGGEYKRYLAEALGLFNQQYKEAFPTDPNNNQYAGRFTGQLAANLGESDAAMSSLPTALREAAVAGTQNATISAMMAARQAGGGRGGLGFGGGGAALAAQMAQGAAAQQNATLTSALVQGRQAQSQYGLSRAGMFSDALKTEASLGENRIGQSLDFRKSLVQGVMGLGQQALTSGLQGESARNANSRIKLFGLF